jgi:hypothetical protein
VWALGNEKRYILSPRGFGLKIRWREIAVRVRVLPLGMVLMGSLAPVAKDSFCFLKKVI